MKSAIPRRSFLRQSSAVASLAALGGFNLLHGRQSPAKKLTVGIMGCNGRGMAHIAGYLAVPDVEIHHQEASSGARVGVGYLQIVQTGAIA